MVGLWREKGGPIRGTEEIWDSKCGWFDPKGLTSSLENQKTTIPIPIPNRIDNFK